jgi:hypothetical protein
MPEPILSPAPPWYTPEEVQALRKDLFGTTALKTVLLCTGGKGGVGKTMVATQLADLCAEAGPVLGIDTDPANRHFYLSYNREAAPGTGLPVQPGVRIIERRLRAEDNAGRVDLALTQDFMGEVAEAPEGLIVADLPAGDSETLGRGTETIVETCREEGIRLVVVVTVGATDRTGLRVLEHLEPMLCACDRTVLVKNTAASTSFEHLDEAAVVQRLRAQPNFREHAMEKIGERILEGLRLEFIPWKALATLSPIRFRVEARRLRHAFHAEWRKAIRP